VVIRSEEHTDQNTDLARNIRAANLNDGPSIWRLARDSGALDTNSCYAYLLLCSDFCDTCFVAYDGDQLAGFVVGYVPPQRPDVVFIWQIGVATDYRGQGLGRELLSRLVDHAAADGARYLEATVTPSNRASQRLFRSLADRRGWELTVNRHFDDELFPEVQHEQEFLIRIGPFKE